MNIIEDIKKISKNTLLEESDSIKKVADLIDDEFAKAIEKIYLSKGKLIITGIGKSAHIANKIVATLNSTGTPSVFLHAAEAVHGDLGIISKDDIVLCISKSGNSPEIKVLVPLLKRDGALLIGMTSDKNSFLGKNSDYILHAYIEKEACPNNLAPTNSTTVQLAIGDAIAVSLMHLRNFNAEDFAKFHPGGALGKKLLLKVENILDINNCPKVTTDASIQDVIIEISGKRLGATAVVDSEKVVGIITDGDIRRMLQKNTAFTHLKANEIMSRNPKTIEKNEFVSRALEYLEQNAITQLIVTDNGTYCGIIHLHDILKEGIVA